MVILDINDFVKQQVNKLKLFAKYKGKDDFQILKHIFDKETLLCINEEKDL